MNQSTFVNACNRAKSAVGHYPMSHRQLALVLGIAPSEFRLMEARYEFPWQHLKALALRFPELGIDLSTFPETAGPAAAEQAPAKVDAPFQLPSLEEMSAFMDAEMARMSITQGAAA